MATKPRTTAPRKAKPEAEKPSVFKTMRSILSSLLLLLAMGNQCGAIELQALKVKHPRLCQGTQCTIKQDLEMGVQSVV